MIKIKQATKDGYALLEPGGVCDLNYVSSKTRRGRVQDNGNICPALTTDSELYRIEPVVVQRCGDRDKEGTFSIHDYSNCLPANPMSDRGQFLLEGSDMRYRIRKLTPNECWRLMDFEDEDFKKAEIVNSSTQLYKEAGNSIVRNVLVAVIGQMIPGCENVYKSINDGFEESEVDNDSI